MYAVIVRLLEREAPLLSEAKVVGVCHAGLNNMALWQVIRGNVLLILDLLKLILD